MWIQKAFEIGIKDEEIRSALMRGIKRNKNCHETTHKICKEENEAKGITEHYEKRIKTDERLLSILHDKNLIFYIDELSQFDWFYQFDQKK